MKYVDAGMHTFYTNVYWPSDTHNHKEVRVI